MVIREGVLWTLRILVTKLEVELLLVFAIDLQITIIFLGVGVSLVQGCEHRQVVGEFELFKFLFVYEGRKEEEQGILAQKRAK